MTHKRLVEAIGPIHTGIQPDHLEGNNGYGTIVFAPGSLGRAELIADMFYDKRIVADNKNRGVVTYAGTVDADDVKYDALSLNTGMGCPSADIILSEIMAAGHDSMREGKIRGLYVLRVGSCGWYGREGDMRGSVAVVDSAITNDNTPYTYVPEEYPLRSHPKWIEALSAVEGVDFDVEIGPTHTKNSLNIELLAKLEEHGYSNPHLESAIRREHERMREAGVDTSSMEEALLFGLFEGLGALTLQGIGEEIGWDLILGPENECGVRAFKRDPAELDGDYWNKVRYFAGSVQAIFGDRITPFYGSENDRKKAEKNAIELSLRGGAQFIKSLRED